VQHQCDFAAPVAAEPGTHGVSALHGVPVYHPAHDYQIILLGYVCEQVAQSKDSAAGN